MKSKGYIFATVRARHSFECLTSGKILVNPFGEGSEHLIRMGFVFYGFSLLRAFGLSPVASPTQGQKSRLDCAIKHSTKPAINYLLNLFQGLTCKPVREPKLYYTVTSFDAILGQVSQSPLGGRGLTYFFLTCCLPFPFFCNPLTLTIL